MAIYIYIYTYIYMRVYMYVCICVVEPPGGADLGISKSNPAGRL